jgi:hypothetical protein
MKEQYMQFGIAQKNEEIEALRARVAELEKDASRYRWLRDAQKYWDFSDSMFITFSSEEHDAAIDAARDEG